MFHFLFENLVLRLNDVVENAETSTVSIRSINLPGEPYLLALSCDHTLLAACYTVNRQSFMDIFAVQTFLSAVSTKQKTTHPTTKTTSKPIQFSLWLISIECNVCIGQSVRIKW